MKQETNIQKDISSTQQINKELLPIYQQAADLQDIVLTVIAGEGQCFLLTERDKQVQVLNDNVAIKLEQQRTEEGLSNFYRTIELIKAELPNTRLG